ncbi:putative pyrroline-5-carboxylate reductase [Phaeomoniella chlamydospora]|uniref:Putative pyrroline-5-carboxylate reductase n=1 Tax=Phaeomoniella chlamydospora TaxID=158046 RepID=A0A0G2EWK4_PHACM|nr:putative pyrroline-5-carboxylate reductase [Phaeomoniella chlamydospora]
MICTVRHITDCITGNMGTAILSGILDATETTPGPISQFTACVKSSVSRLETTLQHNRERVQILSNQNIRAVQEADIIVLGFKPYMLNAVLGEDGMVDAIRGKLVISVLAGISVSQILDKLEEFDKTDSHPENQPRCHVVRAVPNMGARVRESMTIIEEVNPPLPNHLGEITTWIFDQIGKVQILPAPLMDVATILVATPALITIAVDGLLDGAVAEGVSRANASEIVNQSLLGLSKILAEGVNPSILRESTSSPRGCTIQALLQLERQGVRPAFADAIIKGTEHTKGMGKTQD